MKSALIEVYKWKVGIRVTKRVRSNTGFVVAGPDGKVQRVPTKKEALSLLKVRMKCLELPAWKVRPATEAELKTLTHLPS